MLDLLDKQEAPTLGNYALTAEIHHGPWGILYHAKDQRDGSDVLLHLIAGELSNNENFLVRFELLRGLLPAISHKNLLKVRELGSDRGVYYLVKDYPTETPSQALLTLRDYQIHDASNRHRCYESLFEGLARGLLALEAVRDSYHQEGIIHDCLLPENIYIDFEKALVGPAKLLPKIDGFAQSFLFFGDHTRARLGYRWRRAEYRRQRKVGSELYRFEHLFPSGMRAGEDPRRAWSLYQFGALVYGWITGTCARGKLGTMRDADPTLDPLWDEIVDYCLTAAYKSDDELSMQFVVDLFTRLTAQRASLSPEEKALKKVEIPEGMTLVQFADKVELGAYDGPPVEGPAFRARLRPFLMDIHPVSCEEFQRFQSKYQRSRYSKGDQHPATMVSWYAAKAYCRWRSEEEGLPPDTYRLPSEYEWEAAVRGAHGQQYGWGEEFNEERLHCNQTAETGTKANGSYPPGRFGLCDLLGNVWEWTESVFKPHPFSKHQERGYGAGLYVVKGGCWYTSPNSIRASLRAAFKPSEVRGNVGFRCVRPVDVEGSETKQEPSEAEGNETD